MDLHKHILLSIELEDNDLSCISSYDDVITVGLNNIHKFNYPR